MKHVNSESRFILLFFCSILIAPTARTQTADSTFPICITVGMAIDTSDIFPEPFELAKEPFTSQPKAISKVLPQYPPLGMRKALKGTISLRLGLRPNGTVKVAYVSNSTSAEFDDSALRAVMQWKFKPPIVGDKPYPVWIIVGFKYSVDTHDNKYLVTEIPWHVE